MQYQDYYKIPAISRDATAEEIKKSFRKLLSLVKVNGVKGQRGQF